LESVPIDITVEEREHHGQECKASREISLQTRPSTR
jgi:hypothetical protein